VGFGRVGCGTVRSGILWQVIHTLLEGNMVRVYRVDINDSDPCLSHVGHYDDLREAEDDERDRSEQKERERQVLRRIREASRRTGKKLL